MKIALVGYGKMGHMIEQCALRDGHEVVATIDTVAPDASVKVAAGDTDSIVRAVKSSGAEGIIEFTHPSVVVANVKALLPLGLPLVVGTTGWNDKHVEIAEYASQVGGTLMTAGNFSIGVNMFYKIVEEAAKIMADYNDYDVATWEAHHNQKADSPSGTALEIARRVMLGNKNKTEIVTDAFHERPKANQLHVSSTRCGNIPGTFASAYLRALKETSPTVFVAKVGVCRNGRWARNGLGVLASSSGSQSSVMELLSASDMPISPSALGTERRGLSGRYMRYSVS